MEDRQYYVYLLTNPARTVINTGVTNDLKRRVYEHREKLVASFTSRYNVSRLVYFEVFDDVEMAIMREKQIKAGSREKKVDMIISTNTNWKDLYEEI